MDLVADPVPCRECPLQRCPGLRPHEPRELDYMQEFKQGELRAGRGDSVIREGLRSAHIYTLLAGVLIRFRTLDDGRRQIVNFMFPGDLVGLQGAFDEPAGHSVECLLEARLCIFDKARFPRLIAEYPQLGYDLIWLAASEETALEGHIVSLGQRSARERVAYLAVWLLDRALATGIADSGNVLRLPITQGQVADMLGLSLVHTNRTLKQLGGEGLVVWRPGEIRVPDMEKACDFAQFDRHDGQRRPFL